MAVRFNLDRSGVKLSLRQWHCFTLADRQQLLQWQGNTPQQLQAFRQLLIQLTQERAGEAAADMTVAPHPAWDDTSRVPEQVNDRVIALGLIALELPQWCALTPLARYALLKLSRPARDDINILPALREFGLTPDEYQVKGA